MNLKYEPTSAQLKELLRTCDDSMEHVLWVDWDGFVSIKSFKQGEIPILWRMANSKEIKFHVEGFHENEGKVGLKAVVNSKWIRALMHTLLINWDKNSEGYVGIEKI